MKIDSVESQKIRVHALRRAHERYGFRLSRREYEEICKRAKSAPILDVTPEWRDIKVVVHRNTRMLVLWDVQTELVHTFFPWNSGWRAWYLDKEYRRNQSRLDVSPLNGAMT